MFPCTYLMVLKTGYVKCSFWIIKIGWPCSLIVLILIIIWKEAIHSSMTMTGMGNLKMGMVF